MACGNLETELVERGWDLMKAAASIADEPQFDVWPPKADPKNDVELQTSYNPEGEPQFTLYLQSVKKTCAARYLAFGGSLKSAIRDSTD